MNELAHYLDRYFTKLELQELLAQEGTELSEDALDKLNEGQEEQCITWDELMVTEERAINEGSEACSHKEPIEVGA